MAPHPVDDETGNVAGRRESSHLTLTELSEGQQDLLLSEFSQAWDHYRHVETLRSQHLGFAFTVAFALLPILAVLNSLDTLSMPNRLVLMQLVLWAGSGLFSLSLLVVLRFNFVLAHYEVVLRRVREFVYGEQYDEIRTVLVLDVRDRPDISHARIDRVSMIYQLTCTVFSCIVLAGQVILTVILATSDAEFWQVSVASVLTLTSACLLLRALWPTTL